MTIEHLITFHFLFVLGDDDISMNSEYQLIITSFSFIHCIKYFQVLYHFCIKLFKCPSILCYSIFLCEVNLSSFAFQIHDFFISISNALIISIKLINRLRMKQCVFTAKPLIRNLVILSK